MNIDPHELARRAVLAFVLEASCPKEACTSRYADIGPKQRFEDFLVSAVNSSRHFYELGVRIREEHGQPRVFYDLAHQAMMESQRSRSGKIVNYGLLEAMFPVAVSRSTRADDGLSALAGVPEVLRATSREDVEYVAEMRRVIYSRSDKAFKREFAFHTEGTNVFEHYEHHRTVAHEASRLFVSELLDGMPLTAGMYRVISKTDGSLAERIASGFRAARQRTSLPAGAVADFTAVAIYLALSDGVTAEF